MEKKIDWEERRFQAATMIFAGMAANYHNGIYPSGSRAADAVYLADSLIKALNDPQHISYRGELYQREEPTQAYINTPSCNEGGLD